MKLADPLPPTPTINVALIGAPKSGKTTGAASAPGPVLYVNLDLPNAIRYARKQHGVDVVELETEGTEPCRALLREITGLAYDPTCKYKTIVLDPVGELYRILLEEKTNRALRMGIEHRGDVSTIMARFLRGMCEAPNVNFVVVCHDMPVQEEIGGETETVVYPFTGTSNTNLGRRLLGMVDVIAYTGTYKDDDGVQHYSAQLVTDKGRGGGDRFDCLAGDAGFRELNLSEWVEQISKAEDNQAEDKPKEKKQ